jgi:hypothetical protein
LVLSQAVGGDDVRLIGLLLSGQTLHHLSWGKGSTG